MAMNLKGNYRVALANISSERVLESLGLAVLIKLWDWVAVLVHLPDVTDAADVDVHVDVADDHGDAEKSHDPHAEGKRENVALDVLAKEIGEGDVVRLQEATVLFPRARGRISVNRLDKLM